MRTVISSVLHISEYNKPRFAVIITVQLASHFVPLHESHLHGTTNSFFIVDCILELIQLVFINIRIDLLLDARNSQFHSFSTVWHAWYFFHGGVCLRLTANLLFQEARFLSHTSSSCDFMHTGLKPDEDPALAL